MNKALFKKWSRWLERIYEDQLHDLLVNRHIFQQLGDCTKPYIRTSKGGDLAHWMMQGYVAFAATAVRRMVEEPSTKKGWRSVSLVVLLRDLAVNDNELTIERHRWLYRHSVAVRFADRDFARITRNKKASSLSADRINRDILGLKRAAEPIRRLVNKIIAHTEEDRRLRGKMTYRKLSNAIDLFADTFKNYSFSSMAIVVNRSFR